MNLPVRLGGQAAGWGFILCWLCLHPPSWALEASPVPTPAATPAPSAVVTPSAAGTPVCDPSLTYVPNLCQEGEDFRVIRTEEDWQRYVNDDESAYPPPADFTRQMLVILPYFPTPGRPPRRLGVSSACVLPDRIQITCTLTDAPARQTAPRPGGRERRTGRPRALGVLFPPSLLPVTVLR